MKFRFFVILLSIGLLVTFFALIIISAKREDKSVKKADLQQRELLLNGGHNSLDTQPQHIAYKSEPNTHRTGKFDASSQEIVIVLVTCGGRIIETYNAIKSAVVFSNSPIRILVFLEEEYVDQFRETLEDWRQRTNNGFAFELYLITYPETENTTEWKTLVVKCASQRLYFPSILRDIDSVLFIDADILFTRPLEEVWQLFSRMNETQEVALVTECDLPYGGYYEVMAKHPYYKPGGLNAGVMLMNMTRMRENLWTRHIVKYYHTYKHLLHSGDQDLINIYLYFHPDRVLVLNTRYNFRPHKTYCDDSLGVVEAGEIGAAIMHGTAGQFFGGAPIYQVFHNIWTSYELGSDPYVNVYLPIKFLSHHSSEKKCSQFFRIFLAGMQAQFKALWELS